MRSGSREQKAYVADVGAQAPRVLVAEPELLQKARVVHRSCTAMVHTYLEVQMLSMSLSLELELITQS